VEDWRTGTLSGGRGGGRRGRNLARQACEEVAMCIKALVFLVLEHEVGAGGLIVSSAQQRAPYLGRAETQVYHD
jgi:hypothetical protein